MTVKIKGRDFYFYVAVFFTIVITPALKDSPRRAAVTSCGATFTFGAEAVHRSDRTEDSEQTG